MNMNTVYIMLGFIFIYAIVATIRDKRNKTLKGKRHSRDCKKKVIKKN